MSRHALPLIVALLLTLGYGRFILLQAHVELEVDSGDRRNLLKIYWDAGDGQFSEERMSKVMIEPGRSTVRLRIGDLGGIGSLRLDPSERRGAKVQLRRLSVRQNGFVPLDLRAAGDFNAMAPIQGIARWEELDEGIRLMTASADAQLLWRLPPHARDLDLAGETARVVLLFLLVFVMAGLLRQAAMDDYAWTPYLAFVVLALALVMARISAYDAHPDEAVHIAAAQYYQKHWLPPQIGDPAIRHTYSHYGVSRLHAGEAYYWLAGKYLRLLEPLQLPPHLALRSFSLLLWSAMLLALCAQPHARLLALPLLVSPQIWYVFSYANSDAFALFLTMAAAWQVAVPGSLFRRLSTGGGWGRPTHVLLLALLLAMILLCKKNFWFFALFLSGYLLWCLRWQDWASWRLAWRPWCAVVVATGLIYAGVQGVEYAVNGPDRGARLLQAERDFASPMFSRNTPLEKQHPHLRLRERGTTAASLFGDKWRWGEKVFRSSFGVYGYTSVSASFAYYEIVRWLAGALLALVLAGILLRGGWGGLVLLGMLLVAGGGLIGMAIVWAWTKDFQSQGRYFLPLVPMLGLLLSSQGRILPASVLQLAVLSLWAVSVYSFLVVGLPGLIKLYGM